MTVPGVSAELGRNGALEGAFYAGLLDEVVLYDRPLGPEEVLEIYAGGVPADLQGLTSAMALRHWWRLGELDVIPTLVDSAGDLPGRMVGMNAANLVRVERN